MPAINLAQLKTKAARLSEKFSDPDVFVHDLSEFLDFYSNRTIRATQIAQRLSPCPLTAHRLLFCDRFGAS
jgi:hypothetical protein